MIRVAGEVPRFLVVGTLTVLVDFVVYFLLLSVDLSIPHAKTISFIAGALFAYFANMTFTFQKKGGYILFGLFWGVYLVNLVINVSVNSGVIAIFGQEYYAKLLAFLVATGVSASLNFFSMKLIVFR